MALRPRDEMPYIEGVAEDGSTTRLYADTCEQEEIQLASAVTEHAVESGSKISDHYRSEPNVVRVDMFFSGSPIRGDLDDGNKGRNRVVELNIPPYPPGAPLYTPGGLNQAAGNAIGSLLGTNPSGPPKRAEVLQFEEGPRRIQRAFEFIKERREKGDLITVATSLAVFEQMAILDCRITRDAESGDGGKVSLTLQQLTFVSSDVALALPLPVEPRAQKKKGAGNSGTTPLPEGPKKTAAAATVDMLLGGSP